MNNLKDKIVQNIESVLSKKLNGCDIYKQQFPQKISIMLNQTLFDGEYILVKDNMPKIALFYSVGIDSITLLFAKFLSIDSCTYSKSFSVGLFDTQKLTNIIDTSFSQIEF